MNYLEINNVSKTYGTKKLIEGSYSAGDRVLIIDDIVTSGNTLGTCCAVLNRAKPELLCCATIANADLELDPAGKVIQPFLPHPAVRLGSYALGASSVKSLTMEFLSTLSFTSPSTLMRTDLSLISSTTP